MRLRLIKTILEPIKSFLKDPLTYMDLSCSWHMQAGGPDNDRASILKALRESLATEQLFPLPEPHHYISNIYVLRLSLEAVEESLEKSNEYFSECPSCKDNPYKRMFAAAGNHGQFRSLIHLTDSQKAHLKRKRTESGIGSDTDSD
jgi:hypothetical protein